MKKIVKRAASLLLTAALIVPQSGLLALKVESEEEASFYKDLLEAIWKKDKTGSELADITLSGVAADIATDLTWTISDAGELKVNGTGAMPDWSWTENAPWYDSADQIVSVTVGSGITKIGDRAFYNCKNLVSANISDTVITIGNRAFWWCESLTTVHLGSNVATIGYNAFDTCKNLTTINIPDCVTVIGHNAFSGCTKLPNLNLPETVKYVGGVSFYENDAMTTANIPDDTTAIGGLSYYGCDNLTSVNIPESIAVIGYAAFKYCPDLTSVTVPENVNEIGSYAFGYCENLSSVTIYSRDVEFDTNVFIGVASGLTIRGYIGSTAHAYAIKNGYNFVPLTGDGTVSATGECGDGLVWTINDLGDLIISGAGAMDAFAVASEAPWHIYRPYIKTVTIESGISEISNYAFTDFSALTSITVKSRIVSFASNAIGGTAAKPTVYGYAGTTSESFAASKGYTFVALEERPYIASGECGATLTWILYTDGNLEISGVGNMYDFTSASPAGWNDYRSEIKTVTLSYGVASVGDYAFRRCTGITDVEFASTVTSIGDSSFYWCSALENAIIPSTVKIIGDNAFSGCEALVALTLNEGLTKIGAGAFSYCENLTAISIPASVTSIGDAAFASCGALASFKVADSSASYTADTYGVLYTKDMKTLVQYPAASTRTAYAVPTSVTAIAASAFESCQNIRIVNIGNGVLNIGDCAFAYCPNLEKVTIDTRNTAFGFGVFDEVNASFTLYGHDNSTADTYAAENSIKFVAYSERSIVEFGLCGTDATWTLYEDGELEIEGTGAMYNFTASNVPWASYRAKITSVSVGVGVTTIGNYAFANCTELTDIYIGDDVATIGNYAFRKCSALTSVELPNGLETLGGSAFYQCTALENVTVPASVEAIPSNAFGSCTALETVVISDGVSEICGNAFSYCENIQSVSIPASVTSIEDGAFAGCTNLKGFTVDSTNEFFANDDNGVLFDKNMTKLVQYPVGLSRTLYEIPASVEIIAVSAFEGAANLKTVKMGESVTEIADFAFASCSALEKAVIEANIVSFGFFVFDGAPADFAIHGHADSSARDYANENGHNFVVIVVKDVIATGECGDGLTWTLYGDGTLEIVGEGSMDNWTANEPAPWNNYAAQIKAVVIEAGVTTIGNSAFRRCSELTDVSIDGSVDTIGESAFYQCTALQNVDIENGVTTISDSAFSGCSALAAVDIPASVESIGTNAFAYCSALESFNVDADNAVYSSDADGVLFDKYMATLICFPIACPTFEYVIPETVFVISEGAFDGAANIETVEIGSNVSIIEDCAFMSAANLKKAIINTTDATFGFAVFEDVSADFAIHAYNGSSAEAYATENGITFVSLNAPEVTYVAMVGDTSYATLAEALLANGDITLLDNITEETVVDKEVAIIKNGFTAVITAGSGFELIESDTAYNVYKAVTKFNLSGTTMTLGSSLSIDFAVDTSKLTGDDNYAELTIVYADGSEPYTLTVPQSEWKVYSGNIFLAKFTGMSAKQMNDLVTAIVYNANGQQVTNPRSDSITSYSMRQIATGGSAAKKAKLRTLYVDMLNYGAAAQTQFSYDTENLANKDLTATQKGWATASVATTDNRVKGKGYAGSTLTLESEIQLDLMFTNSAVGKDYSKLYAIATYTDHYGEAKEVRIDGSKFVKYGSSYCQISITGMAVADYKAVVSCTVYNSTTGAVVGSASDSVESYANRNAASLGATVDTIVKFGASSYAYFH